MTVSSGIGGGSAGGYSRPAVSDIVRGRRGSSGCDTAFEGMISHGVEAVPSDSATRRGMASEAGRVGGQRRAYHGISTLSDVNAGREGRPSSDMGTGLSHPFASRVNATNFDGSFADEKLFTLRRRNP